MASKQAKNWVRDRGWRWAHPWVGKRGSSEPRGSGERMPGIRRRRLGSQLSNAFDCNYMTINQNSHASSASTLTVYVQNVRSLGVQLNSNKFTRPIAQGCDIYILIYCHII